MPVDQWAAEDGVGYRNQNFSIIIKDMSKLFEQVLHPEYHIDQVLVRVDADRKA